MRLSTLVGAKAGAGVFRDNRAWHGATPNLVEGNPRDAERGISAPRGSIRQTTGSPCRTRSGKRFRLTLSGCCRFIKTDPGVWPPGAGVMHPVAKKRKEAKAGV